MSDFVSVNSLHLNYLTPLLKWRILDLESLRGECIHDIKYKNFHRIIRNLEKKNIIDGYRDPFSRKKFVYLSQFGEKQLSISDNPTSISKETLIHDIKVSEISRNLLELGWIDDVCLEHQLNDKRNFRVEYKLLPDAIFYFERSGVKYKMAFELELTRKNNQRLIEKIRQYESSGTYNYILYLFPNKNLMKKYIEVISEKISIDIFSKIIFFYHENLTSNVGGLDQVSGFYKQREISLKDLFSKNRTEGE